MLTFVSNDGDAFEVSQAVIDMSGWATTAQEVVDSTGNLELIVGKANSRVLSKVLEFCNHYIVEPIEKPLRSANMREVVQDWYADFVTIEQEVLFELILAANYMDITPLLDLSCATVASMIKDKTPEEIRITFNIVNDFTPEEEAQVREENKWCEAA
jgi:S-phase kinase-associated protein 1